MNAAAATPASAPLNMRMSAVFITAQYNCAEASDRVVSIIRIVNRDGSDVCDVNHRA